MMRSIGGFALIVLLVSSPMWAADFRQSNWGDSAEAVMASETAVLHHQRSEEIAFVDSSIEGINGGVIYLFEDQRLVRGVYVSRQDYAGGEGVLADFERIKSHFNERLGRVGEEQATLGLGLALDTLHEDAVVQGTHVHGGTPCGFVLAAGTFGSMVRFKRNAANGGGVAHPYVGVQLATGRGASRASPAFFARCPT